MELCGKKVLRIKNKGGGMYHILGLDLSLCNSGYVVLGIEGNVFKSGVIKSKFKDVKRLMDILVHIQRIVRDYPPKIVVIEGYSFMSKGGRSFSIGELGGLIKAFLYANKMQYAIVAPSSLKKYATAKGTSPKSTIEKEVYKKWKVEFKTEHEVDAYVLARIGYRICKDKTIGLKEYQKQVIKVVLDDKSNKNYLPYLT